VRVHDPLRQRRMSQRSQTFSHFVPRAHDVDTAYGLAHVGLTNPWPAVAFVTRTHLACATGRQRSLGTHRPRQTPQTPHSVTARNSALSIVCQMP
jgi:hypothetical protein